MAYGVHTYIHTIIIFISFLHSHLYSLIIDNIYTTTLPLPRLLINVSRCVRTLRFAMGFTRS